ncbi:NifB/NifX family molybdenum-iron cluster-binding protein [Anaerocolumna sp. MB42-C2]|uniref:NifB/NifX family molybdenum-iron cluster-binding protein n=1 Tax=Anaerocolumna sp. MB42-C2 TaxID=3070997 RepID=UPI003FA4D4B6
MDLAAETIEIVHKVRENTSSEKVSAAAEKAATIKIAVTVDENNNVFQHFGKSDQFKIYEICGEELVSKTTLSSNGSGHSELVTLLSAQKVNVLICGGIGMGAMEGLMEAGILVVPGANGDADVVTAAYLDGSLAEGTEANCDHHDHHEGDCSGECKCHE